MLEDENQVSGGKSGEIFLVSEDSKFIIKTINKAEVDIFCELLEHKGFMDHFDDNPQS